MSVNPETFLSEELKQFSPLPWKELLKTLVDKGDISADVLRTLESDFDRCPRCAAYIDELYRTSQLLDYTITWLRVFQIVLKVNNSPPDVWAKALGFLIEQLDKQE